LEDSKELIQSLSEALEKESLRDGYRLLRFVLTRLTDISLRDVPTQFSGLFAKITHLLTAHNAPRRLVKSVGNARLRMRNLDTLTDEETQKFFLYDVKAVTSFILLIYPDTQLPVSLTSKLPAGEMTGSWKTADTDCLRIITEHFDNEYIVGRADTADSPEVRICYGSRNEYLNFDCSYLTPMLQEGMQLNIIRPRNVGKELHPEMIILEPDFLVDISSIAAGFREYGATPLTALINKIAPSRKTRPMLLGDFAGQLLDEELHGDRNRTYADSISDFCRTHSLDMATCEELDNSFHADAMRQKENIHRAIAKELPQAADTFDPQEVVLEPSFICEMLGIQGRMDFLQRDCSLLIEQKSGKGAFVPGMQDYIYPTLTTPHYVQLLLYRALLHYGLGIPNGKIRPFLLYSKYKHPLISTESAPQLIHQAIRLRNRMVYAESVYNSSGFDFLETLTADDFNVEGSGGKLWTDYQQPQINGVLKPIHDADDTERAYHNAMLSFVQREYVLSKIGNKRKENSGYAARWHDSLEEKKEAGNIIDGMTIDASSTHITCRGMDFGASNFRVGDIVTLFPYKKGTEPDCRKTIIHRASIEEITADSIVLRLRVPQTNERIFKVSPDSLWAIEHDLMDSSFTSQFRGVHSFLSASEQRRSLLMIRHKPLTDKTLTPNGDYGMFNDLATRVKQARELFLIIGPPGTGKTSFGMLNTLKEELTEPDASVAVMAFTNRAVDEICSKLVKEGIDFVRIGSELSCSEEYRPYMLCNKVADKVKIDVIREFIISQKVFVGTTTAFNSHKAIFALRSFTLAIIDEASQLLEPHLLALLSAKHGEEEAIKKFVLIGDHKQLPAVVQQEPQMSAVSDERLLKIGLTDCRLSLFERMLRIYKDDPEVVYMLTRQGRMHKDIMAFPNEEFYGGMLSCVPLPHQCEPSEEKQVQFINVPAPQESPSDKVNTAEAEVIADIIAGLDPSLSVGVIVPYRSQISVIRNIIDRHPAPGTQHPAPNTKIIIDTVERFQGSQCEVIIYGFTVQHPYQLDFLTDNCFVEDGKTIDRKLNVVMTRAMKRLFLVGNASLLATNDIYRKLIKRYIKK
jgi:DNA replication ATP-dependent helicase Dna2